MQPAPAISARSRRDESRRESPRREELRVELRPLGIPDILDGAFVMYRRHFRTLFGITAALSIPLLILSLLASLPALLFFNQLASDAENLDAITPLLIGANLSSGGLGLVSVVVSVVQYAALVVATGFFAVGAPLGVRGAYRHALGRVLAILGANVLFFVIGAVIFGALFLAGVLASIAVLPVGDASNDSALPVLVAFVLVVAPALLGLALALRFAFVTHAIMLEASGPLRALRRSWGLTARSTLRVLAIFLIAGLLFAALQVVPLVLAVIPALLAPEMLVLSSIVNSVATQIVSLFLTPLPVAIATLTYFDLRVRREGYDLRRRAERMAAASLRDAQPEPADALPSGGDRP